MNKYLLVLSVFGMGVASISSADISNISNAYGSPQNTYSNEYVSSDDKISQAIDSLNAQTEQKKERLASLNSQALEWQLEIDKQQRELAKKPNARIGMTRNQILNKSNWGEPDDINTTIDAYGTFEQWVYGDGQYLYFTNDKLTSIQY